MATLPFYRAFNNSQIAPRFALYLEASYRRRNVSLLRTYASAKAPSSYGDTARSSSKQAPLKGTQDSSADQGYLSFTRASLYKLTLPLVAPTGRTKSPTIPSDSKVTKDLGEDGPIKDSRDATANGVWEYPERSTPWEQQVEGSNKVVSQLERNTIDSGNSDEPVHSVIFLLHSGQPLSYIENLVRAEVPEHGLDVNDACREPEREADGASQLRRKRSYSAVDPTGMSPITFHTWPQDGKRWSPSTGIGDFLREAARVGSFTIRIGKRAVVVNVPSFEERSRFLRASLHAKTAEIERLAKVKDECDRIARRSTQRVAFAGAGILGIWWVTVGVLTFHTPLGWDTMEPITYLTGLGTVISGYLWFLWHNREVNYRSVLSETTSRRQSKLYSERGFNIEKYHELIDEAKELRGAIKRVAWDYELTWDQGDTEAGQKAKRALQIIRGEEEREKGLSKRHDDEVSGEGQDDALGRDASDDCHEPDDRTSR